MAETGIPDYQFIGWWGIGAPARTPRDAVARAIVASARAMNAASSPAILLATSGFKGSSMFESGFTR